MGIFESGNVEWFSNGLSVGGLMAGIRPAACAISLTNKVHRRPAIIRHAMRE